jgi:hypothetical protein
MIQNIFLASQLQKLNGQDHNDFHSPEENRIAVRYIPDRPDREEKS